MLPRMCLHLLEQPQAQSSPHYWNHYSFSTTKNWNSIFVRYMLLAILGFHQKQKFFTMDGQQCCRECVCISLSSHNDNRVHIIGITTVSAQKKTETQYSFVTFCWQFWDPIKNYPSVTPTRKWMSLMLISAGHLAMLRRASGRHHWIIRISSVATQIRQVKFALQICIPTWHFILSKHRISNWHTNAFQICLLWHFKLAFQFCPSD